LPPSPFRWAVSAARVIPCLSTAQELSQYSYRFCGSGGGGDARRRHIPTGLWSRPIHPTNRRWGGCDGHSCWKWPRWRAVGRKTRANERWHGARLSTRPVVFKPTEAGRARFGGCRVAMDGSVCEAYRCSGPPARRAWGRVCGGLRTDPYYKGNVVENRRILYQTCGGTQHLTI